MFRTEWLLANDALRMVLIIGLVIFMSFAVGRIIQRKLKVLPSNTALSMPIGFFAIQLLFFILSSFFLMFPVDINFIYWLNNSIYIGILLAIFAMTKDWMPRIQEITPKTAISFVFVTGSIFALWFFQQYLNGTNWYSPEMDQSIQEGLTNLYSSTGNAAYVVEGVEFYLTEYQTMAYWIATTAEQGALTLEQMNDLVLPALQVMIISTTTISIFKHKGVPHPSIFAFFASMAFISMNGFMPEGMMGFLLPLMLLIVTMLVVMANENTSNRSYGYIAIGAATVFFTFTNAGIIYFTITAGIVIYTASKYDNSPTYQLNGTLMALGAMVSLMILSAAGFTAIFSLVVFLAILIPLNLAIVNKNSSSIINIDNVLRDSRRNLAIFAGVVVFAASAIVAIINQQQFVDSFYSFYTGNPIVITQNAETNNMITGILYGVTLGIPLVAAVVVKDKASRTLLHLTVGFLLLFNPLTVSTLTSLIGFNNSFSEIVVIGTVIASISVISVGFDLLKPAFAGLEKKYQPIK